MAKSNDSFSNNQLKQIREVFNEGIEELVIPQFEKVYETQQDHTERLARIETRQQNDQGRFDNHDRRISRVEKRLSLPHIS